MQIVMPGIFRKGSTAEEIAGIDSIFAEIDVESAEYHVIDLSRLGSELKDDFDRASLSATSYQRALRDFTDDLTVQTAANRDETAQIYANLIEPKKRIAEDEMNAVFEAQSTATTRLFFRAAQQFLFVLLFLFFTMTVGVIGILRMRRNAGAAAEAVDQERQRTEQMREKNCQYRIQQYSHGLPELLRAIPHKGQCIRCAEPSGGLCAVLP